MVIGTKGKETSDMPADQSSRIKNGKTLQGRPMTEVDALVDEEPWKAEKKTLSSNKSLMKQANLQLDAEYKHQQRDGGTWR
jgi:hypothetical protein